MMNIIRQLPISAPKEALPFLADLCLCTGFDPEGLNEDTAALLAWADTQITKAQMGALAEILKTDTHPRAMNFVSLESWRLPYGSFNPAKGCQWAQHGFQEWLEYGAFNTPTWTWRALKGLQFGTNPRQSF